MERVTSPAFGNSIPCKGIRKGCRVNLASASQFETKIHMPCPIGADKPRCGAKTRAGRTCQNAQMTNGRCRMHGGSSSGAPANNQNARKYSIYSRILLPDELETLEQQDRMKLMDLEDEIIIATAQLKRVWGAEIVNQDAALRASPPKAQRKIRKKRKASGKSHRPDHPRMVHRLLDKLDKLKRQWMEIMRLRREAARRCNDDSQSACGREISKARSRNRIPPKPPHVAEEDWKNPTPPGPPVEKFFCLDPEHPSYRKPKGPPRRPRKRRPALLPETGPRSWPYASEAARRAHLDALDALPPGPPREYARPRPPIPPATDPKCDRTPGFRALPRKDD